MKRRAFVWGSVLMLTAPLGAEGQTGGEDVLIGYLLPGSDTAGSVPPSRQAYWLALKESGFVDLHQLIESLADLLAGLTTADGGEAWLRRQIDALQAPRDSSAA